MASMAELDVANNTSMAERDTTKLSMAELDETVETGETNTLDTWTVVSYAYCCKLLAITEIRLSKNMAI